MDFPIQPIPIPALRAARAALGLKQHELAKVAGVSPRTIFKIEKEGDARMESVFRVQQAFERLGVNFSWNKRTRRMSIELPAALVDWSQSGEDTKVSK
ncbi:helix-turn-helix domain-containing protein [Mesorhizobium sp. M0854]|uniref:helix-turn-helix domain-containing protein n=1 Tax=Mesorhizobium sp. M0854 TaxID=2957013 RepID=UPI00333BB2CF